MDETSRIRRRSPAPLVVLTALAIVPAVGLGVLWQYADANVPPPTTTTTTTLPPPPEPELMTDLLSFRRHPTPLAEEVAAEETAALNAAEAEALEGLIPPGSCLMVVDGDTELAAVDPLATVIPGSNQKLLIAAVALDVLGPEHTFATELVGPAPVGNVVPGSVYLVGGGDPSLWTADVPDPRRYPAGVVTAVEPLVAQLLAAGITLVDGDVVGDGGRYDDEFSVPTWGDGIVGSEVGRYDALVVNNGLLDGRHALDPNRAAARVVHDLLRVGGVQITGSAANGPLPADAGLVPLATLTSAPLDQVLEDMLHTSDNTAFEMLVKEIGFVARGEGTRSAGLAVVQERLHEWGVPLDGSVVEDGSGLSRNNRSTCVALASIVSATPVAEELIEMLPIAGTEGTLAYQFGGTAADGAMAAKTGTLTDVKALSGSQPAGDGTPVEFSLVLNGTDVDEPTIYQPIWQYLAEFIERYPIEVEPDVAPFGPLSEPLEPDR